MNKPTTPTPHQDDYAAYIGIDWADQKHDVCLWAAGAGRVEHTVIEHTPEALADWVHGLRRRFGGRAVAVCLEQTRGALIYHLMQYEFIVLMPLAPKRLARYRESVTCGGAKDDPTDADLILDYLIKHRDRLRVWKPDDALTRQIGLLSEQRRKAVDLRTGLSNALRQQLKGYFPQVIAWLHDTVDNRLAADFLLKWPTLGDLQRAKPQTIRRFFYAHHSRRMDRIETVIEQIRDARPLTTDTAIVQASVMSVRTLARLLKDLADAIDGFDRRIGQLFATHPDAPIFQALPGAGKALAPRLLAAFGTDRDRLDSADPMQSYCGVAPVTQRSGRTCVVHRRWACSKFLRQTFHEFAKCSLPCCAWARAYYQQQRDKGKGHHTAIRAVAFKWIRIIFRCWKNRTPYDEATYLRSLRRRGSPIAALLPVNATDPPRGKPDA